MENIVPYDVSLGNWTKLCYLIDYKLDMKWRIKQVQIEFILILL